MTEQSDKIFLLIDDIADTLERGTEVDQEVADKYGKLFSEMLISRLKPREPQQRGSLRMSNIGKPCERQLYYDVNNPTDRETLPAATKMKFLYGDVVELLMLALCEISGHTVEGTQGEQEITGIKGHRDAVISGMVVDVKSAASMSFKKFENGTLANNDPFGYIGQLQSYLRASQNDPIVTHKEAAAFLVLDKQLGHFCLDVHQRDDSIDFDAMYEHKKEMVTWDEPPERAYTDIPEGTSGNMKLPVSCSYCAHHKTCWPELRTFLYSKGPVHLTVVEKTPNVPEVTNEPESPD